MAEASAARLPLGYRVGRGVGAEHGVQAAQREGQLGG